MEARLESYKQLYGDVRSTKDVLITTFERELRFVLKPIKSGSKNKAVSNNLFALLNKYSLKLGPQYYRQKLVEIGDQLKQVNEYSLALTHGYGRYLQQMGVALSSLGDLFKQSSSREDLELNLRSVIGASFSSYKLLVTEDSLLKRSASHTSCLSLLHSLKLCVQSALRVEALYWLLYNAITLSYSICRMLITVNIVEQVIEPLIWCCVSMESCVPLMTAQYLSLRGTLYTAVCQCYYSSSQPAQAEMFARRCLDKVHQLAQIQAQARARTGTEARTSSGSSSPPGGSSTLCAKAFTEVTIKLCVMIFRRSVLETHKKTRSILRPKVRPAIKDLLQTSWPRSPTERLLEEMFKGKAAQFLAIMECLFDPSCRPLERVAPHPVTDLDNDTVSDVFHEVVTAGVELANEGLTALANGGNSEERTLIELATNGSNTIPLDSIIRFIHLCYCSDNYEAFSMLAPVAIQYCSDVGVVKSNSLSVVLECEEIRECLKRGSVVEDKEVWTKSQIILQLLFCSLDNHSLPNDLVLDAAVLIWEGCGPLYDPVMSHDSSSNCKPLLSSCRKYVIFLSKLLSVFRGVGVALIDPLLHCKVLMKYTLLLEMEANVQSSLRKSQAESFFNPFMRYDRAKLLYCQQALREGLSDLAQARDQITHNLIPHTREMVEIVHTEFVCADIRVAVKLASTIPPNCPFGDLSKPSSLPHKIREREEEKKLWQKMVSSLTAHDVHIPSEQELLEGCGSDKYRLSILLMTIVSHDSLLPGQSDETKNSNLLKEAHSLLSVIIRPQTPPPAPPNDFPLPPVLLHCSPTSMTFRPAPFISQQPVCYYSLYGRKASGSNVKVRLGDCYYPGLGIEVPAGDGCTLTVSGLQPHVEYVFAVAAYGPGGELIGQSIGIPTPPILASYSLSHGVGWGLLAQCAYRARDYTTATKSSDVLWKQFVHPLTTDDEGVIPTYRLRPDVLSSTPTPLIRLFATSVLVGVHSQLISKGLYPDTRVMDKPLLPSQLDRLQLIGQLRVGLKVFGWINDHSLCLQVIAMCYTLLVPIIQLQIISEPVTETLLQCLAVLQELPDSLLTSKSTSLITGLHHMIAAVGHYLVKSLSSCGHKSILPQITELLHSKLILTLPTTLGGGPAGGPLHDSSLSSTLSSGLTSLRSHSNFSSLIPLTTNDKVSKTKKKRKKLTGIGDNIAEELKSPQYKAMEGYFISTVGLPGGSDDLDLTGQEDPVLLHAAIKTLSIQGAYREVVKFKRRPQYLEYFTHLACSALSQGRGELILEWSRDVFTWLRKRNEIILSAKSPQVHRPDGKDHTHKPHPQQQALGNSINQTVQSSSQGAVISKKVAKIEPSQENAINSLGGVVSGRTTGLSVKTSTQLMLSSSSKKISLQHSKRKQSSSMVRGRITRDDLKLKAVSVLQSILPRMWRVSRCRRKLRAVCAEEQPWRAQINMFLASCILQNIIDRIQKSFSPDSANRMPPNWFRLDVSGCLMEGVVPPHPPSMPKEGNTQEGQSPVSYESPDSNMESPGRTQGCEELLVTGEVKHMISHIQKAIVLSHRGGCGVLAVNACRLLWNSLTVLRHYINQQQQLLPHCPSASLLYGISLQCLYLGADVLLEVYSNIDRFCEDQQVAENISILLLDRSFLYQFLLLALHVCYSNRHWEKVLTLEQRMDPSIRLSLGDSIKPLMTHAKQSLVKRLETHSQLIVQESIDPAAHLDIRSYNLYGTVGFSLGMSALPLDTSPNIGEEKTILTPPNRGKELLTQCRCLYSQYLSTRISLEESEMGISPDSASISDVEHIVDGYKEALNELKKEGGGESGWSLQIQAMHELGNLMYYMNNRKSASNWWSNGLRTVLHCKQPLSQWRSLDLFKKKGCALDLLGVWGCVLGGVLASKMGRYIHYSELDTRLEYNHLAAALFKSLFHSSLPHPIREVDYASYTPSSLLLGPELFTDHFRCSSSLFIVSLHDTIKELVTRKHTLKVLPLIALYEHASDKLAHSIHHTVLARVYRSEALVQMGMYGDAIQCIRGLMTGADLPLLSSEYHTISETHHLPNPGFTDSLPLNHPKNIRVLSLLLDRQLSASLRYQYGVTPTQELLLIRAHLLISLASTCTGLSPDNIVSRNHDNKASSPLSSSSHSSTSSWAQPLSTSTGRFKVTPGKELSRESVKMVLLEEAEKSLVELTQNTATSEASSAVCFKVRAYLFLSEISLALSHYWNATNLALSALRVLQDVGRRSASSIDPLLWLQTRVGLARGVSLLHIPLCPSLLDMSSVCKEGIAEAEALGEAELASEFLYLSGVYRLVSVHPLDLKWVESDVKACLQTLEGCAELSQAGQLLKTEASLLLAEVACVGEDDYSREDMIKIYEGIGRMIEHQLSLQSGSRSSSDSAPNIYKPQLKLKSLCSLRLAHLLNMSKTSPTSSSSANDLLVQGLSIVQSVGDTLLMAEYLSQSALIRGAASDHALRGAAIDHALSEALPSMIEAIKYSTSLGLDHIQTHNLYCRLCEAMVAINNQTPPQNVSRSSVPPSRSESRKLSRLSSRHGSRTLVSGSSTPKETTLGTKEDYQAWCALRLAATCIERLEKLALLASELHHSELNSSLPDSLVNKIPDCALLDLCPSQDITEALLRNTEPHPLNCLLPSNQFVSPKGLTWFILIGYYNSLLRKCFWPSSVATHCNWGLRSHCLSSLVSPRAKVMLEFLVTHCPLFKSSCTIPSVPRPLLLLLDAATSGDSTPQQRTQTIEAPSYLTSGEEEVSVFWYPLPGNTLRGLFSLSHKNIKSLQFLNPSLSTRSSGCQVFVVSVDLSTLAELRSLWEELAQKCNQFVTEQVTRPLSRSPSRMRRKSLEIARKGTPQELQDSIQEGLFQLLAVLGQPVDVMPLGAVSPQAVPSINRVLKTLKPSPEKGEAYMFFKQVFNKEMNTAYRSSI